MKTLRVMALFFCAAALAAIAVYLFTDWNDEVFWLAGLTLSAAGNIMNILYTKRVEGEKGKAI